MVSKENKSEIKIKKLEILEDLHIFKLKELEEIKADQTFKIDKLEHELKLY